MMIKSQGKIKNKKFNNKSTVLRDSESQLLPSRPVPSSPIPSTPPLPAERARDNECVIRWHGAGDLGRKSGQV